MAKSYCKQFIPSLKVSNSFNNYESLKLATIMYAYILQVSSQGMKQSCDLPLIK